MLAGLLALLAMNLWQGRTTERALDRISVQLDAKERARIDMLEARVIVLEKALTRMETRQEE